MTLEKKESTCLIMLRAQSLCSVHCQKGWKAGAAGGCRGPRGGGRELAWVGHSTLAVCLPAGKSPNFSELLTVSSKKKGWSLHPRGAVCSEEMR